MSTPTTPVIVVLGTDPGDRLAAADARALNHAVIQAARTAGARVVMALTGPLGTTVGAAAADAGVLAPDDGTPVPERVVALAGPHRVTVLLLAGDESAVPVLLDGRARHWSIVTVPGTGGLATQLAGDPKRPAPQVARGDDLAQLRERHVVPAARPARVQHLLVWELDDAEVVKQVLARREAYDLTAQRLQHNSHRVAAGVLCLGVLAVFLAVLDDQLSPSGALDDAFRWALIVLPAIIAALVALDGVTAAGKRWLVVRAACEAVKREIFVWRTRTGVYAPEAVAEHPDAPADATELLVDRVASIEAQMMGSVMSASTAFAEVDRAFVGATDDDDGLSRLDADGYLRTRADDQLAYYQRKVVALRPQRRAYQVTAILAGGAGSILAAAGAAIWTPVVFAIGAALGAFAKQRQLDTTLLGFSRAKASLVEIRTRWDAAPPGRHDEARFERLVRDVENALELEQGNWAAQMKQGLDSPLPQYEELHQSKPAPMPEADRFDVGHYDSPVGPEPRAAPAPPADAAPAPDADAAPATDSR